MLEAARRWQAEYGHPPAAGDWKNGTPDHPASATVVQLFGHWGAMIAAAGYEPRATWSTWTRESVVEAFLDWVAKHGRWPTVREWDFADEMHPHFHTVMRLFGTWNNGRREAGYTGSSNAKTRSRRHSERRLVRAA